MPEDGIDDSGRRSVSNMLLGWVRAAAVSIGFTIVGLLVVAMVGEVVVRVAGVDTTPPSSPFSPGMRADLLLGNVPRGNWSGPWLPPKRKDNFEVITDEDGFRLTGLEPPPSPNATIAFMGDSCTFGWGVDTPDTYLAELDAIQRQHGEPKLTFINGGVPGNSAVAGLHHLRERVLEKSPDTVVLAFSGNNAFRFSLISDVQRFDLFRLRKLVFRSQLVRLATIRVAIAEGPKKPTRNRDVLMGVPVTEWHRVADPVEFEWSIREMVEDTRSIGASPLFLLFPRAVELFDPKEGVMEDPARFGRKRRLARGEGPQPTMLEMALLESSCLDIRDVDAVQQLHDKAKTWQPLRPRPVVGVTLKNGATSWVRGETQRARERFTKAFALQPDNPMVLYDLGVAEIESGDTDVGLARLERASELACNVFFQYQVILRRLALELDVPVVDILMEFQTHYSEPFMLDSAHFTKPGNHVVAEALWRTLGESPTPAR